MRRRITSLALSDLSLLGKAYQITEIIKGRYYYPQDPGMTFESPKIYVLSEHL